MLRVRCSSSIRQNPIQGSSCARKSWPVSPFKVLAGRSTGAALLAFTFSSRPFATAPRIMALNGSSAALRPEETTGSTPADFISPPDKPGYHAYRLPEDQRDKDWIAELDLETATAMMQGQPTPLRFLVLYGSLRETSYSRLLAFEMARLLEVR
jgi:hypothetical protein